LNSTSPLIYVKQSKSFPDNNGDLFYVIGFLLLFTVATEFKALFWTQTYAQNLAFQRVKESCLASGRDPELLTFRGKTTIGPLPILTSDNI
jgi:hypothetical protein